MLNRHLQHIFHHSTKIKNIANTLKDQNKPGQHKKGDVFSHGC